MRNLTFDVRGGEIYGIAGVGGNGQSALVEAVMGIGGKLRNPGRQQ